MGKKPHFPWENHHFNGLLEYQIAHCSLISGSGLELHMHHGPAKKRGPLRNMEIWISNLELLVNQQVKFEVRMFGGYLNWFWITESLKFSVFHTSLFYFYRHAFHFHSGTSFRDNLKLCSIDCSITMSFHGDIVHWYSNVKQKSVCDHCFQILSCYYMLFSRGLRELIDQKQFISKGTILSDKPTLYMCFCSITFHDLPIFRTPMWTKILHTYINKPVPQNTINSMVCWPFPSHVVVMVVVAPGGSLRPWCLWGAPRTCSAPGAAAPRSVELMKASHDGLEKKLLSGIS